MPEVCEIVMTAQYLLSKLKNRYITKVEVLSGRYTHQKLEGLDMVEKNKPLKIVDIDSKGKFMYFVLSNNDTRIYLLNSFGMTGKWGFHKESNSRILFVIKDTKINKTYKLYYTDQRNFGTLKFTNSKSVLDEKLSELAPDYLKTEFTENQYYETFKNFLKKEKNKSMQLYYFLTEQKKNKSLGSGLGNYLTAEIMYYAKLSPFRSLDSLSKADILRLANSIKYITKLCYINNKVGYMEQFVDFIEKHKKGVLSGKYEDYHPDIKVGNTEFKFSVYGQDKDPDDNPVQQDTSDKDRTIHWVPSVQK